MKLVFTSTTMAPNILTLTGLHDSAKSARGNVVIVFGVEKDPALIGNITKNIDNSVNDRDDNKINSRRNDKSAIGVKDHVVSDVIPCLLYTSDAADE